MGVARDNLPRDGQTYGFMAGFAEVEVDVETGVWTIVDFVGVADVGTVIHPHSLGGQILGGGIQGIGHVRSQKLVYDPHYGAGLSTRMHHNKPPTILDIPLKAQWAAVGLPDPTNPIGAKGIGEPSTVAGGGRGAVCAGRRGRRRHHPPHTGAAGNDHGDAGQQPPDRVRTVDGVHLRG